MQNSKRHRPEGANPGHPAAEPSRALRDYEIFPPIPTARQEPRPIQRGIFKQSRGTAAAVQFLEKEHTTRVAGSIV